MKRWIVGVMMMLAAGVMVRGATVVTPVTPRVDATKPQVSHGAEKWSGIANPHLHGVKPVAAVKGPVSTKGAKPAKSGHVLWRNGWDVVEWRTKHLGHGGVRGVLVDAAGHPLAGKAVWLRYASGNKVHHHWEAHATHTDASGHFSMSHVIAKEYRLCARVHGHLVHEQIEVQAGTKVFEHLTYQ